MRTITFEQLQQKLNTDPALQLVNALEPSRFELMHIPNSMNIPYDASVEGALAKGEEVVVYCTNNHCFKSRVLYQKLEAEGFNVRRYTGGLMEWESRSAALERDKAMDMQLAA